MSTQPTMPAPLAFAAVDEVGTPAWLATHEVLNAMVTAACAAVFARTATVIPVNHPVRK